MYGTNKEYQGSDGASEGANSERGCPYYRWHEGMVEAFRVQRYDKRGGSQFHPA